ncbi:MAG: type III pantothenate kinase [Clostridia bacterium]|nr:type III pantothenate kinase [Clostridia bacterium]
MLLAIDIGNTNIKYGLFKGSVLTASFRVSSRIKRTADEYGSVLINLLASAGVKQSDITGIIISSVIPSLNYTICHMCEYFFNTKPIMIGRGIKTGLNIRVDHPKEVGADRIVNSVAGFRKYGNPDEPLVIIDFGTATTFNVLQGSTLIGGVIAPGIKTALESLVSGTAQLPMIELRAPKSVIAKDTESNMQAGIVFGFAGLVEKIVDKIKTELGVSDIKVIATGGMGEVIAKEVSVITKFDRKLTLDGLRYIYELNSEN